MNIIFLKEKVQLTSISLWQTSTPRCPYLCWRCLPSDQFWSWNCVNFSASKDTQLWTRSMTRWHSFCPEGRKHNTVNTNSTIVEEMKEIARHVAKKKGQRKGWNQENLTVFNLICSFSSWTLRVFLAALVLNKTWQGIDDLSSRYPFDSSSCSCSCSLEDVDTDGLKTWTNLNELELNLRI